MFEELQLHIPERILHLWIQKCIISWWKRDRESKRVSHSVLLKERLLRH